MDSNRLQPALYGGLFIGVLSALPIVNAGNCCCCLWVVAGGALATYLRQQNLPFKMQASEGAVVGLLAGVIGGVVAAVLSIPMQALTGDMQRQIMDRILSSNPDLPAEARDMVERLATGSGFRIVSMMVGVLVDAVFGMLGGLLGVAIFKKDAPPPPPPGTVEVLSPERPDLGGPTL
jgi:hypothetical protein